MSVQDLGVSSFYQLPQLFLNKSLVVKVSGYFNKKFVQDFVQGLLRCYFLDPPADRLFMAWLYHIGFLRNGSSWSPLTSSQMVRPIWGPRSAFCVLSPSPSGKISPLLK